MSLEYSLRASDCVWSCKLDVNCRSDAEENVIWQPERGQITNEMFIDVHKHSNYVATVYTH